MEEGPIRRIVAEVPRSDMSEEEVEAIAHDAAASIKGIESVDWINSDNRGHPQIVFEFSEAAVPRTVADELDARDNMEFSHFTRDQALQQD